MMNTTPAMLSELEIVNNARIISGDPSAEPPGVELPSRARSGTIARAVGRKSLGNAEVKELDAFQHGQSSSIAATRQHRSDPASIEWPLIFSEKAAGAQLAALQDGKDAHAGGGGGGGRGGVSSGTALVGELASLALLAPAFASPALTSS